MFIKVICIWTRVKIFFKDCPGWVVYQGSLFLVYFSLSEKQWSKGTPLRVKIVIKEWFFGEQVKQLESWRIYKSWVILQSCLHLKCFPLLLITVSPFSPSFSLFFPTLGLFLQALSVFLPCFSLDLPDFGLFLHSLSLFLPEVESGLNGVQFQLGGIQMLSQVLDHDVVLLLFIPQLIVVHNLLGRYFIRWAQIELDYELIFRSLFLNLSHPVQQVRVAPWPTSKVTRPGLSYADGLLLWWCTYKRGSVGGLERGPKRPLLAPHYFQWSVSVYYLGAWWCKTSSR